MPVAPKEVLLATIRHISEILREWETKRLAVVDLRVKEEKKQKGFLSRGPNQEKIKDLNLKAGAVSREQRNLIALNDALTTLVPTLSEDNKTAIAAIREVVMIHYIDEYAFGRVRKDGSPLLKAIEDVILKATANPADNFFLKNEHLAIKKGVGHEHFDSRFLACQYALVDPELPKIVGHIFSHVMDTSIPSEKNAEVYTAYMKALVRVGLTVGASEWNSLVNQHLGNAENNNPFQITLESVQNFKENFTEKAILANYNRITTNALSPELNNKLKDYLAPASSTVSRKSSQDEIQVGPARDSATSAAPEVADSAVLQPPPLLSTLRRPGNSSE